MLSKILRVLLYAIIFLVPVFFLPFTFNVLGFNKLYLLFFLSFLALLVCLLKAIVRDKEVRIYHSIMDYAVLVFLLVTIVSFSFSVDKISALFGFYGRFANGLLAILSFVIVYFLVSNNLKSRDLNPDIKNQNLKVKNRQEIGVITVPGVIKTLLASGMVAMFFAYFALFGIWTKLLGISKGFSAIISNIALRVSPIASNIEGLAIFLVITSLLAVFVILGGLKWFGMEEGEKKKKKERKWNIVSGIYLSFAVILLVIADFLSAWIILIVGMVLLVGFILKQRILKNDVHKLILPIGLVIVSLMFVIFSFRGVMSIFPNFVLNSSSGFALERSLTQSESWSVASKAATSNFKDALIGTGPGTYYYDYGKYKPAIMSEGNLWSVISNRSGNQVSEILATMGFLGFLSFLLVLATFFLVNFLSKDKRTRSKQNRSNFASSFFMVLLFCLALMQFLHYQTLVLGFLFWLFLGLGMGLKNNESIGEEKKSIVKRARFKLGERVELALILETVTIILSLVFIVACFFGGKFYLADVKYVQALNTPDLAQKVNLLRQGILLNPHQSRYQVVVSMVYFVKAQNEMSQLKTGDDQSAVLNDLRLGRAFAENAVLVAPVQASVWQSLADFYQSVATMSDSQEQFINLAIEALDKGAELDPKNPKIYDDIGSLYLTLGQKDKAEEYFTKSLVQKKDYISANINLAFLLEDQDKRDEAISILEAILSINQNNPEILFQLGRLYYNDGQIVRAITHFKRAITINANYSDVHYALGLAYEKQGKIQQAIEELQIVFQFNPGSQEVANKLQQLKQGRTQVEAEIEKKVE